MLEDWIREQPESVALDGKYFPITKLTRTDSGLHMILDDDNVARIYVPTTRRAAMLKLHHEGLQHLAAAKTYSSMARTYY